MKTAYLFDIGNVILRFDFSQAAAKIAAQCTTDEPNILPLVQPYTNALETGTLPVDQFVAEVSEKIGFAGTPDEFIRAFEDIFTVNQPIVALIESLAAKDAPLYLFSNTNAIHVPFFTKEYDVFGHFHGAIYSHEVGAMKPDEPMFHTAVQQYGLNPSQTIYIDDLAANIETGKRLGFRSFQYDHSRHHELEAWLE